jgi:hypothetical protein
MVMTDKTPPIARKLEIVSPMIGRDANRTSLPGKGLLPSLVVNAPQYQKSPTRYPAERKLFTCTIKPQAATILSGTPCPTRKKEATNTTTVAVETIFAPTAISRALALPIRKSDATDDYSKV